MTTATVSKLKASLSEYLRRVKAGEEVLVSERGRPIAKLVPVTGQTPCRITWPKWPGRVWRGSGRDGCPERSGVCRGPRIRKAGCSGPSWRNASRADEVLGQLGRRPAVRGRAAFRERSIPARGDPAVAVWWATRTECLSALTRRMREGGLAPAGFRAARRVLAALAETWVELLPSEAGPRDRGAAARGACPEAADAFQLGAALAWCGGQPSRHEIVTLDIRLRDAASREGFDALPDGD